jgi:8-oxo-dGTP diphosphatase
MKQVDVAVGVVFVEEGLDSKLPKRHFFICRRSPEQHQGNRWEFPGGKVDYGETPLAALKRELHEEIDIRVDIAEPLIKISHNYPDKRVCLHVFLVKNFTGDANGAEGQESRWVQAEQLSHYTFPDANTAILRALSDKGLIP